jgi:glycosyltransferase involved in cell wall biosynthesis
MSADQSALTGVRPAHPGGPEADRQVQLSIVVPLYNEEENVGPVVEEVLGVLDTVPIVAEVILVDDGSRDTTGDRAFAWQRRDSRVKVLQFRRNFGQTAAISAGFDVAGGRVIVVMDGDQQNDPHDIPGLLAKMAKGYDVVSGWRVHRKDKLLLRRLPSLIANRLISRTTGTELHDYGCTLKAYDSGVVRHLNLYGEMHRFIPALASMAGARVTEVPVNHRPRLRGTSKYGISRTFRVLLDLLTVKFLLEYLTRPIQFFGRVAALSATGVLMAVTLLVAQHLDRFQVLSGGTWVSLATMLVVLGVLALCVGLLGEVVTRSYYENGHRRTYVVRRRAGFALDLSEAQAPAAALAGPVPPITGRATGPRQGSPTGRPTQQGPR